MLMRNFKNIITTFLNQPSLKICTANLKNVCSYSLDNSSGVFDFQQYRWMLKCKICFKRLRILHSNRVKTLFYLLF